MQYTWGVTMKLPFHATRYIELLRLNNHFRQYFQVVPALTPELIREAQLIRHDVYSSELGWEPVHPGGLEQDEYDTRSLHCLLKAVRTQRYIGCVRLVLPHKEENAVYLPFQKTCLGRLHQGHPDPDAIAQGFVAEVSRLAIVADYRRRKHEKGRPFGLGDEDYSLQGRRRFPYIPVGLYIGMLQIASLHGIKTLYIMTEPLLAIHFSRLGGKLKPVGDIVEHRGKRRPYVMQVDEVLKEASLFLRPLIRTIAKDVKQGDQAAVMVRSRMYDISPPVSNSPKMTHDLLRISEHRNARPDWQRCCI